MTNFTIEFEVQPPFSYLPGFSAAQRLSGQDVGAGPCSEGHSQWNPQTRLPDKGGPAILHRPSDETEPDEMRHAPRRPPGRGSSIGRFRWNRLLLYTEEQISRLVVHGQKVYALANICSGLQCEVAVQEYSISPMLITELWGIHTHI